jgi:hypothetical protein
LARIRVFFLKRYRKKGYYRFFQNYKNGKVKHLVVAKKLIFKKCIKPYFLHYIFMRLFGSKKNEKKYLFLHKFSSLCYYFFKQKIIKKKFYQFKVKKSKILQSKQRIFTLFRFSPIIRNSFKKPKFQIVVTSKVFFIKRNIVINFFGKLQNILYSPWLQKNRFFLGLCQLQIVKYKKMGKQSKAYWINLVKNLRYNKHVGKITQLYIYLKHRPFREGFTPQQRLAQK